MYNPASVSVCLSFSIAALIYQFCDLLMIVMCCVLTSWDTAEWWILCLPGNAWLQYSGIDSLW